VGPSIGILAQFVGMPLLAYLLGYIFLRDERIAWLGLLLLGCSPGGTASNFWTTFFKGDLNLSVTMTFCSSVASFALSTFWIWALGQSILDDDTNIELPYLRIFLAIVSLVLPICLGMLLKYKKPDIALKLRKISRPFFLLFVIVHASIGIYINRAFFSLVAPKHVLVAVLLSASGFLLGFVLSLIARLKTAQIIAVAIETAVQNPSAAFIVMQTNIKSPYTDIGSVPIICYVGFAIGPPMLVALTIFKLVECYRNKTKDGEDVTTAQSNGNLNHDNKKTNRKREEINLQKTDTGPSENLAFES